MLIQIVEEESQKHSFWKSEICRQTVSFYQSKTWNRKILEYQTSSRVKIDYRIQWIHSWNVAEDFDQEKTISAICKWFHGFSKVKPIFHLTCKSTITCFQKPKMFAWLIQFIKKILPTELCIPQLEVLLNPNPCHFCKRRTRFFHWLPLWLS